MLKTKLSLGLLFLKSKRLKSEKKLNEVDSIQSILNKKLIKFPIFSYQIEILDEPHSFFTKLKVLAKESKKRITISSLYIGTGEKEKELINLISFKKNQIKDLKVTFLLDYTRGTRLNEKNNIESSSKHLLQPISSKSKIAFFLSPIFSNFFNKYFILPRPMINETLSVQHIKCYLFDDNVIMSGANLSDQYFTTRQDRYVCFYNCPELCNYLDDIIQTISKFSFHLNKNGELLLDPAWKYHPLNLFHKSAFIKSAQDQLNKVQVKYLFNSLNLKENKTLIVPLLQMKLFNIEEDSQVTYHLFNHTQCFKLNIASGYFNLTQKYIDSLICNSNLNDVNILMASEEVNGFYNAKNLKGYIPSVYTNFAVKFFKSLKEKTHRIKLWSYYKEGWTFHSKGLWMELVPDYFLVTIGSSNFGYRSVERDLELQLLLITREKVLANKFRKEYENLWKQAYHITDETKLPFVSIIPKLISVIAKNFF